MMPSNVDVPAFHEGFADLVALFLHFTYADVVEQAMRESAWLAHPRLRCSPISPASSVTRVRRGQRQGPALRAWTSSGIAAYDS